ncbi:hypothetical protein HS088_TW16G00396 [Tripterygium wilfordii]|uniref:Uncharacterized protein n=1 Tax=Tripterygium wilfordii TaxID=458696 RepID=A0A7J7CIS7_TRIWF|nr:hypothetical protein HS088_TW16G00396 [Tripterygium wilfordii]
MSRYIIFLSLLLLVVHAQAYVNISSSKCALLCGQCSRCDTKDCPPSSDFPHLTGFDDFLIVAALQSDLVPLDDRGVYSVSPVGTGNTYYGWGSHSGSVTGFHRYSNYMDKCSDGPSFLTVDEQGKVSLRLLKSLTSLAQADWKTVNPPPNLNHRGFKFLVSGSTGKCLTVFGGVGRRIVGTDTCSFVGLNLGQLFAFRFHYQAFCCCGVHNS